MSALFQRQTILVKPIPEPSSKQWDIKGEDDLGLSSRYMTEFKIVDSRGKNVRLEDLDLRKKKCHYYAVGVLISENKQRVCIKTDAIRCWNVEVGIKPSSGIWITTKKAWYKLMKPHQTYTDSISPLIQKSKTCILIAAILRSNGTDLGLEDMKLILSRFEKSLVIDPSFIWTHLKSHFSSSSYFMTALSNYAAVPKSSCSGTMDLSATEFKVC